MITWLLVAMPAVAQTAEVESVAQIRHDLFGERMAPAWQYFRLQQRAGELQVDGYLAGEWVAGGGEPGDFDLYRLSVSQAEGSTRWRLGRQRAQGALRQQTFDGAQLETELGDLTVGIWGGVARHQDLDDLLDGSGISRVQATLARGLLWTRAGAQVEAGPKTPVVGRGDLEARLRGEGAAWAELAGRLALAKTGGAMTAEWAQVAGSARLWRTPLRGQARVAHREAADPNALFGDAILDTLTDGGVDELALGMRASGPAWTALESSWTLSSYDRVDGRQFGHGVDASWSGSPGASLRAVPSYRFRSGPGGSFHSLSVVTRAALGGDRWLTNRLAAVPYQSGVADWDVALHGGVALESPVLAWLDTGLSLDLARDRTHPYDLRAGLVLSAAVP